MVVALWRRGNRCRAAMDVQTLRRRTSCILRYRLIRHLLGHRPLRLAFGQRRQRRHRRSRGARLDRRLGLFVAAAEADIGQPLQQRQPGLLRVLLLSFSARLPDNGKIASATAVRRSDVIQELNRAIYTPCIICSADGKPKHPTWSISADRVVQDKKRRLIFYRNARIHVATSPVTRGSET